MEVFFQMRFSYCGKPSGILPCRTKASKILNEATILRQFDLLERVTLPSLRDQSDPSFRLVILTSARMPEDCKEHLTWLLNHYLPGRSQVLYSRPMIPGRVFRRFMQGLGRGDVPVIQTQVVEGDAFGTHFVQKLREHSIESWANAPVGTGGRAGKTSKSTFLSFKRGLSLGMKHKCFVGLEQASTPATPFALSLVSRPSSRYNPMLINPDGLGVKFPHTSIMTQDFHCLRAQRGEQGQHMKPVEAKLLAQAAREFSILQAPHKIPTRQDLPQCEPMEVDGVVRFRQAG